MTSPNFLRYAGLSAILGAVITLLMMITGVLFFTVGAPFGRVADIISVLQVASMIPVVLVLHIILNSQSPVLSSTAVAIGILGILVIGVLQTLLVVHVVRYAQIASPTVTASGAIGIWLLMTTYLAWRSEILPRGLCWVGLIVGIGYLLLTVGFWLGNIQSPLFFVGSTIVYLGYPIWAIWLGRWLMKRQEKTAFPQAML